MFDPELIICHVYTFSSYMLAQQRERSGLMREIASCDDKDVRQALRKLLPFNSFRLYLVWFYGWFGVFSHIVHVHNIYYTCTTTQICKHCSDTIVRVHEHIDEVPDGQNAGRRSLLLF